MNPKYLRDNETKAADAFNPAAAVAGRGGSPLVTFSPHTIPTATVTVAPAKGSGANFFQRNKKPLIISGIILTAAGITYVAIRSSKKKKKRTTKKRRR